MTDVYDLTLYVVDISLELSEVFIVSIGVLHLADGVAKGSLSPEFRLFLVGLAVIGCIDPSQVCELGNWTFFPRCLPLHQCQLTFALIEESCAWLMMLKFVLVALIKETG